MMMLDDSGSIIFSGKHLKGESDGKWIDFTGYDEHFTNYKIDKLRNIIKSICY